MLKVSKEHLLQNGIGLIVLIVVGLIFWPLAPKPNLNPSGILLPNATLKAPITADQVQVLQVMPTNAEIMGNVRTKLYYASLSPNEQNQDATASLNYAKTLAAAAGANGLVVTQIGATMQQGPLDGVIVYATPVSY